MKNCSQNDKLMVKMCDLSGSDTVGCIMCSKYLFKILIYITPYKKGYWPDLIKVIINSNNLIKKNFVNSKLTF